MVRRSNDERSIASGIDAANPRVTVKEVAERAGVHPSTVSRALSAGTNRVSADLVARVLAAADELSYRPNRLARALRVRQSSSIGMLIPDILNPAYPPIVRGAEDALRPAGLSVLLASTDNDVQREREFITLMLDRRVDGLLLATATRKFGPLDDLLRARVPVVLANRGIGNNRLPLVTGDDVLGIDLAIRHLRSLGHQHIAHLAGTEKVSSGYDRKRAFIRMMKATGTPANSDAIVSADDFSGPVGISLGESLAQELLRRRVSFTAVVAANDLLAIGCYDVLKRSGLAIPSDVSIVGYNDIGLVDRVSPPLTTIHNPLYEIGFAAGELLLSAIKGSGNPSPKRVLAPTLVVRQSTAPPKSSAAVPRSHANAISA
jgi:LacI family transcriptional regulator